MSVNLSLSLTTGPGIAQHSTQSLIRFLNHIIICIDFEPSQTKISRGKRRPVWSRPRYQCFWYYSLTHTCTCVHTQPHFDLQSIYVVMYSPPLPGHRIICMWHVPTYMHTLTRTLTPMLPDETTSLGASNTHTHIPITPQLSSALLSYMYS